MLKDCAKYAALFTAALLTANTALADNPYYYDSNQYSKSNPYDSDNTFAMEGYQMHRQDEQNFARTGKDYYVYGGYLFSFHFNDKKPLTVFDTSVVTQASITPKDDLPDMFSGIEIGFGKEWGKHLDVQIAYLQQFEKTKTSTILRVSPPALTFPSSAKISTKGLSVDFLYIINPDDRIQAGAELGAEIMHIEDVVTANINGTPTTFNMPDNNTTEIDPTGGLEFIFQFTPSIALRVNGQYTWHTQSKISSGEVNAFVGLSYIM